MGYTTDFEGSFYTDRVLDNETTSILVGLNETRRMKRNIEGYGTEGEFYFGDDRNGVVDYNRPPSTQPGLWCQWQLLGDRRTIEWDGGEKFYNYVEWIEYIVKSVLEPRGYLLNGEVNWFGEDRDDMGKIKITNNHIEIFDGAVSYH